MPICTRLLSDVGIIVGFGRLIRFQNTLDREKGANLLDIDRICFEECICSLLNYNGPGFEND